VHDIVRRHLGIEGVAIGFGLPDDGIHGANESIDVEMHRQGIRTMVEFWPLLAEEYSRRSSGDPA
jgi:acetylornithine deacetylase/succinyl-diaminopimelate desuccinylase-like protein